MDLCLVNAERFAALRQQYGSERFNAACEMWTHLQGLTEDDVSFLGTSHALPHIDVVHGLARKWMSTPPNVEHAFWTGMVARQHCVVQRNQMSLWRDADCPFTSLLFDLCVAVRESQGGRHCAALTLISYAISRLYASMARGTVHVFISSDKPTEPPGLTPGNNFCEAELPVLQDLVHQGLVDDILVYTYTAQSGWANGTPFADIDLPIWRRTWHPLLDPLETKSSFVLQYTTQAEWDAWRLEPPRTFTTLCALRRIVTHWKALCHL